KLKALSIEKLFDDIIISEEFGSDKLNERNFLFFQEKYPDKKYVYIGDNPQKDFIVPNKLNWQTYCLLNNGKNILPQNFKVEKHMLPKTIIKKLEDLLKK
ncbi:MAG: HAD family hydrolase, partial [Spirochaetaceae bacterium]|nr:HAD family hydrolase [Spirochaetaceae bacterium]